jgi:hypothetical protein
MDRLKETLRKALASYTGEALNGYSYLTANNDDTAFAVISIGYLPDRRIVDAGLIVRLLPDRIIIERDLNDKPLVEMLLQADVPRHQIVLAYAGEPVNEPVA